MGVRLRNLDEFILIASLPIVTSTTPGIIPDSVGGVARNLILPFQCRVRAQVQTLDSGATVGSCTIAIEDDGGTDVTKTATHDNADAAGTEYQLAEGDDDVPKGTAVRFVCGAGLTGTTQAIVTIVLRRTGRRDTP